jgi:hypothetical protein
VPERDDDPAIATEEVVGKPDNLPLGETTLV